MYSQAIEVLQHAIMLGCNSLFGDSKAVKDAQLAIPVR